VVQARARLSDVGYDTPRAHLPINSPSLTRHLPITSRNLLPTNGLTRRGGSCGSHQAVARRLDVLVAGNTGGAMAGGGRPGHLDTEPRGAHFVLYPNKVSGTPVAVLVPHRPL